MKTIETDYLIVGAGLAGSAVGYLLSRDGASVLSIEIRDMREKDKLCAGFMIPAAVSFLAEVFGEDAIGQFPTAGPIPWVHRGNGREVTGQRGLRVVRRKDLDDYCLGRLLEAGGSVCDRARLLSVDAGECLATCRDLRTGELFAVRYGELIGADGALSSVRKMLTGRPGRTVLSFEGVVPTTFDDAIITGIELDAHGYCWYAPRGADATVGCLYSGLDPAACKERLERFCADLGYEMPKLRGAFIPSGDDVLLQAGEHAWLVGDAAGLADAFGGGGIHNALMSALMLADSFAGGKPYEEGMRPQLAALKVAERQAESTPMRIWWSIVFNGTEVSRTAHGSQE